MNKSFRRKRTAEERRAMEQEALGRAIGNQTMSNWPDIFAGFMAKGIAQADILPRENVFTYHAWRALGRQVRRGEHGVKVTTWIKTSKEERDETTGEVKVKGRGYCTTATVFHISQTDAIPGERQSVIGQRQGVQPFQPSGKEEFRPDPLEIAYEDRCAETAGINPYGPPE